MGNYLNTAAVADTYSREFHSPYFIDKSLLLEELMMRIETNTNYICITRPRRFGKSVMANMIAAFFSGAGNVGAVFEELKIAASDRYKDYAGKYDVVFNVDFIFYPEAGHKADGIILELKVNDTPEHALQQIKDKKYALKFEGKLGEQPKYQGRILGVGIGYDKAAKIHSCKIEVLRNAI